MTGVIAVDTSVAVPLVVSTHRAHSAVADWWNGRPVALSGHALVETYSVLTRLPGDARLTAADAATLIKERFADPLLLAAADTARLTELLAAQGIAGGAVYDAIVGLAAARSGCVLATRDARATGTYQAVGATIEVVT
ncbi:MAG: type II toxin-antitoxin system VapC family toxin [Mycolicibacterium sp.]|uniref:type II toxin-antitoxin system VapC family toxin n=1 Tax=Mycolicibacterium sp. TaxID=2320850 RepID=UPI003D141331